MKHYYIRRVLDDWDNLKLEGIYFSGKEEEGEYKEWYWHGGIKQHSFFRRGLRHGEYKSWHPNGQLFNHHFYHSGMLDGEFKKYDENGELIIHRLYKSDNEVRNYLE